MSADVWTAAVVSAGRGILVGLAFNAAYAVSWLLILVTLPPTRDQMRALVAADPASIDVWMAAGFALPRSEPTDPGNAVTGR